MKKNLIFLLLTFATAAGTQAQFLKQLLNSVKETSQNRANSKANQATNKALDKVDSSTQLHSGTAGSNPSDTAATNSVLGAFAKAAAQNPNDTSSADLTMKALGILTSGPSVSPQDSAKAIRDFQHANGGSGFHYEYSVTSGGAKFATVKDTSRLYLTNNGEGRHEMRIPFPGQKGNEMVSIGHFDEPQFSILLYADSKTYSLTVIDTAKMMKAKDHYRVTKIGIETVAGYSCTHARLVSGNASKNSKSTVSMDIWTSTEVPGYSLYKKLAKLEDSHSGMLNTLADAGCEGFFVKLVTAGKDYSVEELLIEAKPGNLSADLFRIPSGYSESNEGLVYHMIPAKK